MNIILQPYSREHIADAIRIWNQIVEEGTAFPQKESLTEDSGNAFFSSQSFTGLAFDADAGNMLGLYILHPNNVGRCRSEAKRS